LSASPIDSAARPMKPREPLSAGATSGAAAAARGGLGFAASDAALAFGLPAVGAGAPASREPSGAADLAAGSG